MLKSHVWVGALVNRGVSGNTFNGFLCLSISYAPYQGFT